MNPQQIVALVPLLRHGRPVPIDPSEISGSKLRKKVGEIGTRITPLHRLTANS
jgi:hypothetical protein